MTDKGEGFGFYSGKDSILEEFEYMQLIGIKDVENKDVYEGDIVEVQIINEFGSQSKDYGKVEYQPERGAFVIRNLKNPDLMTRMETPDNGRPNFKVIGNIYENPGLLIPPKE